MRKLKPGDKLNRRKLCNKNRRTKTVEKLRRRKTAQKLKISNQNDKQERDFICDSCGNKFMLKHHLVRHTKTCVGIPCEKKFKCDKCQKMFKSKKTLNFHQKKM